MYDSVQIATIIIKRQIVLSTYAYPHFTPNHVPINRLSLIVLIHDHIASLRHRSLPSVLPFYFACSLHFIFRGHFSFFFPLFLLPLAIALQFVPCPTLKLVPFPTDIRTL